MINLAKPAEVDIEPSTGLSPAFEYKQPENVTDHPAVGRFSSDWMVWYNEHKQLENVTDHPAVGSFSSDWMLWDKNQLERQPTQNSKHHHSI